MPSANSEGLHKRAHPYSLILAFSVLSTYTTVSFDSVSGRPRSRTGWSGPALSTNCIRTLFVRLNIICRQRRTAKTHPKRAGLGDSVGCAVRLETRRSRVQPPPKSATFLRGDWSWNIFYGHSLPSADSRRAVVSFWRKNVHNTG